jgi:5-methylcytosine-specific restriction endonuclease McrA
MGVKHSRLVLPTKAYKALCDEVMERDKYRCTVCGRRNNLHCHHIVFRSHGGDDATWNMMAVCGAVPGNCHDAIHSRYVVVLPKKDDDERIDADKGVRLMFINGWQPKWRRRR